MGRIVGVLVRAFGVLSFAAMVLMFLGQAEQAYAQSIIKQGSASRSYKLEIEPRAILTPFPPPQGQGDVGLGAGVNFGINIAPKGFLPSVYDSVALGIGLDAVQYFGGGVVASECSKWQGTGDSAICVQTRAGGGPALMFYAPVVMQWNFYLTPKWSVFGEPGFSMYLRTAHHESLTVGAVPVLFLGARYHFSSSATLTMRVGYPYTTIGVSFFP